MIACNIFRNFSSLFIAEVFIRIMTFVLTVMISRIYGPMLFGVYSLGLSIGMLFDTLLGFGLHLVLLIHFSRNKKAIPRLFGSFLWLKGVLAVLSIAAIGLFIVIFYNDHPYVAEIFTFSLFSVFLSLLGIILYTFIAVEWMKLSSFLKIICYGILFILSVFVIFQKLPFLFIAYSFLFGVLAAVFVGLFFVVRQFHPNFFLFETQKWISYIREGIPIAFSALFIFLYADIDKILLSLLHSEQAVGYYNAPYKVMSTVLILSQLINDSFFPSLTRIFKKNSKRLTALIHHSFQYQLFFSIAITLGGFVLGRRIIEFIYGPMYEQSVMPFLILIWTVFIFSVSSVLSRVFFAGGKTREIVKVFFAGAVFNTVTNLIFIPRYGVIGASVTTIVTEIFVFAWLSILTKKYVKVRLLPLLWQPLASGIFMIAVLSQIQFAHLTLTVLFGAVMYSAVYFGIGSMTGQFQQKKST